MVSRRPQPRRSAKASPWPRRRAISRLAARWRCSCAGPCAPPGLEAIRQPGRKALGGKNAAQEGLYRFPGGLRRRGNPEAVCERRGRETAQHGRGIREGEGVEAPGGEGGAEFGIVRRR